MNILITLFWFFVGIWCGCFIGWIVSLIRKNIDLIFSFNIALLVCALILNLINLIGKANGVM